jgi:hypothetical protein
MATLCSACQPDLAGMQGRGLGSVRVMASILPELLQSNQSDQGQRMALVALKRWRKVLLFTV